MTNPRTGEPMTTSGWCQFPSPESHAFCATLGRPCTCTCHTPTDEGTAHE